MGNSSSHTHEPLERGGFTRGIYGDVKNSKSASFRLSKKSPKKMDRIRRSFRDSFRRRKDRVPESSKPHQWQADEQAVRSATCSFPVKYLGCVEVFESRGMQVCEEALKVLRSSRRRPIRGLLHVSGDGLRVVDDETKGLIVDQTIEKVSFCAPDRNHERGFSYICRDGTTRRWMCHGFLANKDSGERLSHAVGCAFAVCLERKQRRDKECGVTMTFDMKNSTFTRSGSFRQQTLTERIANSNGNNGTIDSVQIGATSGSTTTPSAAVPPQPKPYNPFAIERPHATPSMLERQGSFRAFSTIGSQSPFKRQMSLRINDLPSNAERQKAFLDAGGGFLVTPQRNVSPIPESASPQKHIDTVSQLCQELSQGLSLLTKNDIDDLNFNNAMSINQNFSAKSPTSPVSPIMRDGGFRSAHNMDISLSSMQSSIISSSNYVDITSNNSTTISTTNAIITSSSITGNNFPSVTSSLGDRKINPIPKAEISPRTRASISGPIAPGPLSPATPSPTGISISSELSSYPLFTSKTSGTETTTAPESQPVRTPVSTQEQGVLAVKSASPLPNADQWLGEVVKSTSPAPRRAPALATHGRARSLSTTVTDPFDAEWASGVTRTTQNVEVHSTNPFISPPKPPTQSFQVQL